MTRRHPAHVNLKVHRDLASLRVKRRAQVIRRALAATCRRDGFRIVDWSIQGNHLHLVLEADNRAQLSRGMQAFGIRVARGLNRLAGRRGQVFTERYHLRILRTPAEVRAARAYVLNNFRRHAAARGRRLERGWVDPCSSWAWFDGWRDLPRRAERALHDERAGPALAAEATSWLLRVGWRQRGLVSVAEVPGDRLAVRSR